MTINSVFTLGEIGYSRLAKHANGRPTARHCRPAFVRGLKFWGKARCARTRYHDFGLNISEAGEMARQLADGHIVGTGVDPKTPLVDLVAANFKRGHRADRISESRASEVESADVTSHAGQVVLTDAMHDEIGAISQDLIECGML